MGLALPVFAVLQVFLEPQSYKDALTQTDFYNRYTDLFVEQMVYSNPDTLSLQGLPCINVAEFSAGDWRLIADQVTPPAWLKVQTESLIDQVFTLPENDDPAPSLNISTLEFKNLMASDGGFTFYQAIIADKHDCTFTDIFEITAWALNPFGSCLAICRPFDLVDLVVRQILPTLSQSIPDTYNLTPFIGTEVLIETRSYLQLASMARSAALIAILLSFALLPLTLFARQARSCSGWLLYWGAPLTLAGVTVSILALTMLVLAQNSPLEIFRGAGIGITNLAPGTLTYIEEFAAEIIQKVAIYAGLPGVTLFITGLFMLSISAITRAVQDKPTK